MKKKYHVTGRLRIDVEIDEIIDAMSAEKAGDKGIALTEKKHGITSMDVLDVEIYADAVE